MSTGESQLLSTEVSADEETAIASEEDDCSLDILLHHDHKSRIRMLQKFRETIASDTNFDQQDLDQIDMELERLRADKLAYVKQTLHERLETLKEADDLFHFEEFHPSLNEYWLRKHEELTQKQEILEKSHGAHTHTNSNEPAPTAAAARGRRKKKLLNKLDKQERALRSNS